MLTVSPSAAAAVSDFFVGGVVGQDVLVDVVADVLVGDLAQVGVDGDVSVVIGQSDVIQSGDVLQVAVVVVSLGEAEISQVVVSGLVRLCGLLGGGGRSGFLGSSGFGSSLAGSSASRSLPGQRSCPRASTAARTRFMVESFMGFSCFLKLHTFLLYTHFGKSTV